MDRVRMLVALLALVLLPGCFGLFGGPTASISGTVRIDASPRAGEASSFTSSTSTSIKLLSVPGGTEAAYSSAHRPVEVLLYADRLSASEARELAESNGFSYLRSSRHGYYVLRDRLGRSESQAIRDLQRASGGARVEPNPSLHLLSPVNDPRFSEQWALQLINAVPAWEVDQWDLNPVIVAIVDTGIDFNHPDLAANDLWVLGRDFASVPNEEFGIAYGPGVNDVGKARSHGTMVAGIVAALTDNGVGVAGTVGPTANIKLMPILVVDHNDAEQETIARAVEWAVENGADVINLSLGQACYDPVACPQPESNLSRALDFAYEEGVVVVAAAGNFGGAVVLPANYRTTIAVGAARSDATRAGYSAMGDQLDVMAPGGIRNSTSCAVNVVSLRVGSSLACDRWGTSISAPHVSGIVALMISRSRALGLNYHPDDVRQILQITATDIGNPGWDPETGYGLVNAHAAVTAGVPQIFLGTRKGNDEIQVAGATVRSQLGGVFRMSDVPEGAWTLFGWVDADANGTVNEGDYFQEYGEQIIARKGRAVTNVNLVLTPYEGDELIVSR